MSKSFLAEVIADASKLSQAKSYYVAGELLEAIIKELKLTGKFTLSGFGTFTVRKTKARRGLNPRTGATIKVKAGKTVKFKPSPVLKKAV
jgi:DNA-binding protein HU-beta